MVCFTPQPGPQTDLITADWCPHVFYGGSRYGGKTYGIIGDYAQDIDTYGKYWKGIFIRKTYQQLRAAMDTAYAIFSQTSGEYKAGEKAWFWPNGARFYFLAVEQERDMERVQGDWFTFASADEVTNYSDLGVIKKLQAVLRCGEAEVPTKRIRTSGNPGGPGHSNFKQYYIEPCPEGFFPIEETNARGVKSIRMYIPARATDNIIGLRNDPYYIERLSLVGSEALVRMWLDGNWDVVAGAYFDCFNDKNIVEPFTVPQHWTRWKAFDWGYADPFCCLWFALSDGSISGIPRGCIVVYREVYGAIQTDEGYIGCRASDYEISESIKNAERDDPACVENLSDSRLFDASRGPSMAKKWWEDYGVKWKMADNSRVSGWQQVRMRMIGNNQGPGLVIFNNCKHLLRVIPMAQHHERDSEDMHLKEDHALDPLRYGIMRYKKDITEIPKSVLATRHATVRVLYPQFYKELVSKGLRKAV